MSICPSGECPKLGFLFVPSCKPRSLSEGLLLLLLFCFAIPGPRAKGGLNDGSREPGLSYVTHILMRAPFAFILRSAIYEPSGGLKSIGDGLLIRCQ